MQEVIRSTMREKYASKGETVSAEFFESVTHEARLRSEFRYQSAEQFSHTRAARRCLRRL